MFDYVASKYGTNHISHISTITITQPKSAYKTACRVIEKALDTNKEFLKLFNITQKSVDKITSLPYNRPFLKLGDTLSKGYDISLKELEKKEIKANELTNNVKNNIYGNFTKEITDLVISYASILCGMPSSLGLHAAGCIISDNPITDYAPVRMSMGPDEVDVKAIEADMIQAEEDFGLLKMDFLGLKTLDVIATTLDMIEDNTGLRLHMNDISLKDENVYREIFQTGKTNGIFQFESEGMKDTLRRFGPDKFEDVVLINALFRPGPAQYIDSIIEIKEGKKKPQYIIESLKPILETTYGFPVYQEQLMQIFNKAAGFSLSEADIIRRALSKKVVEKFIIYKPKFISGLMNNGTAEEKANAYWDELLEFANYAFNKSHACAYSLLAYRCAWLKYYYPKEFACASLTYEDKEEKKGAIIDDLKSLGVKISSPDFRTIQVLPTITGENSISIGLANIKGIGKKSAEEIINYRNDLTSYNLFDIAGLSPAAIDAMASVGMFDYLKIRRYEIKNVLNEGKFELEKILAKIEEKENEIEDMYQKLSNDSGLDINKLKLHDLPPEDSDVTDTVYIARIKKINKIKNDIKKEKRQIKEKILYLREIQSSLQENIFKVTLEDKRNELEAVGFYLGDTPFDMANEAELLNISKGKLKTDPTGLKEGEEAYFPLIVTSGFLAPSKNGNEYITLKINDKPYRSFDEDVIEKAEKFDLITPDTFKFMLLKIKKRNGYCNVTDIVQEINTDKKEAKISIRNRTLLPTLMKEKEEPIRVYIENENKFVHIMGKLIESDFIKIY